MKRPTIKRLWISAIRPGALRIRQAQLRNQWLRRGVALAAVLALQGCAGLNVQWAMSASYNTEATTTATMTPGKPEQK